jgi:NADH-quinone oxidoreductase subunit M
MLYLYQRTMFGKIENPKNERLIDLNNREFATFAPLLVLAFWMGLYPAPFLRRLETSVAHVMSRVNKDYAQAYAMALDCGPATPASVAASTATSTPGGATATDPAPAAQPAAAAPASTTPATSAFMAAAPCGPDGKPLPQSGVPR